MELNNNCDLAVVGCGSWGKNLVRNFSDLRALRCICDTDTPVLQPQAEFYPDVFLSSRFEDVLADKRIRAVVLATPAACHYEQAKAALDCGKDVFVEKPMALSYKQGCELDELAKKQDVVLMVGHILEYHPAITMLKDIVRRGELGQLRYLYSNRLNLGKVRREENILWSFAPHDIAVICRLVGNEPTAVNTSGGTYLQPGIADVTMTSMTFADGVRAHIFVSWLHPFKEQKIVVVGERKMIVFEDTATGEGKLKIYDKGIEWRDGLPLPRQTAETTLRFEETEPLRIECEHFLACVRERRQPLTDGASALRVLKVLEASQLSLERSGAPVSLIEVGKPASRVAWKTWQ